MNEQLGKHMTAFGPEQVDGRRTFRWLIRDHGGGLLGTVAWYTKWRQYCFEPMRHTVFRKGCLLDLADFLRRVNKEHKPSYVPKR